MGYMNCQTFSICSCFSLPMLSSAIFRHSTDRRRFHGMQMITSTTRSDTKIHRRLPNKPVQVTMANVNIQLECNTTNTKLPSCLIKTKHCVYSCIYFKGNKAELIF